MLVAPAPRSFDELDQRVFQALVPTDHYLRKVAAALDFERLRPLAADHYSPGQGRPAIDPVRMVKLLFLVTHYRLDDRAVMARARTDAAFRWFLGLRLDDPLPHHTSCTYFRQRLGQEGFEKLFHGLLAQAREHGLLSDKLRLKDATHLYGAGADLSPTALAAQLRDHLLTAAAAVLPDLAAAWRSKLEALRAATAEATPAERLAARIAFLRELAGELRAALAKLPSGSDDRKRKRLEALLALADKALVDHAAGKEGKDKLVNAGDPEARLGWHHGYFVGYLLDLAVDAESELIAAVGVLPGNGANGAEAADTLALLDQEQRHHGNQVEEVSLDGAGHHGGLLRELAARGVAATAPIPATKPAPGYGAELFTIVEGAAVPTLRCPAGQTTSVSEAKEEHRKFRFAAATCRACPQRGECLAKAEQTSGRSVTKNAYQAEYAAAAARAATPAHAATRAVHPRVERKHADLVRNHGLRQLRYRGLTGAWVQSFLAASAANVKRIVKLLALRTAAAARRLGEAAATVCGVGLGGAGPPLGPKVEKIPGGPNGAALRASPG